MGILTRYKDIMEANINALLDKAEDPEKMVDQYLRNLESDLGKVKAETAAVMADEAKAKRELDSCKQEVDKYQAYAEKALKAGNESDARAFLEKKQSVARKLETLQQNYDLAAANATKMREMHDKLVKDINSLKERRDEIKAKANQAKAMQEHNKIRNNVSDTSSAMAGLDRMDEKVNRMLDEANAMTELNQSQADSDIDNLAAKYDSEEAAAETSNAVDDELAALKAQMGL